MEIYQYKRVRRAALRVGVKLRGYAKYKNGEPKPAYSGRGMFGRETLALIVYRHDIGDFEEIIKKKLGRDVFADLRIDNLGLDYIIY